MRAHGSCYASARVLVCPSMFGHIGHVWRIIKTTTGFSIKTIISSIIIKTTTGFSVKTIISLIIIKTTTGFSATASSHLHCPSACESSLPITSIRSRLWTRVQAACLAWHGSVMLGMVQHASLHAISSNMGHGCVTRCMCEQAHKRNVVIRKCTHACI